MATDTKLTRISWIYEELVLVADVLSRNEWRYLQPTSKEARELSALLKSGKLHGDLVPSPDLLADNFRSLASVARKTSDILTSAPEYQGVRTNGNKLDAVVLEHFRQDEEGMREYACQIRRALELDPPIQFPHPGPAMDGGIVEAQVARREADQRLKARKLAALTKRGERAGCEVCGFSFEDTYGERGKDYIEIHDLSAPGTSGNPQPKDFALLCANCHRICHRRPWISPAELKLLISRQRP